DQPELPPARRVGARFPGWPPVDPLSRGTSGLARARGRRAGAPGLGGRGRAPRARGPYASRHAAARRGRGRPSVGVEARRLGLAAMSRGIRGRRPPRDGGRRDRTRRGPAGRGTHGTGPVAATVEVRIHGISSTGAGGGRLPDGRVVLVPGTAPGELARIRMERDKGRWASAPLVEVLAPSPDRRAPLCALYGVCGGCRLQHLPEETQRRLKAEMVAETLGRIGGLRDVAPPEVVPSPRATGYRSRMSWTLRRLGRGRLAAGLHALDRPAHVVD